MTDINHDEPELCYFNTKKLIYKEQNEPENVWSTLLYYKDKIKLLNGNKLSNAVVVRWAQ